MLIKLLNNYGIYIILKNIFLLPDLSSIKIETVSAPETSSAVVFELSNGATVSCAEKGKYCCITSINYDVVFVLFFT